MIALRRVSAVAARRAFSTSSAAASKNVAVVLSGSGVYDGTELTEGVATLVHLSRAGATVQCFAPDEDQMHAIDHTKGEPHDVNRNALQESARIARGNVNALGGLSADDYDAVIFPGGFGAAKNLSTWAVDGVDCSVNDDVARVLREFGDAGKPVGLCCIAPVLAAKVFAGDGQISLTVGSEDTEDERWPYAGTAGQIKELGATHVATDIGGVAVDEYRKIVTSPAYMYEGAPHEVFDSVGLMVEGVLGLVGH